jgi:integral membrane protein
VTAFFVWGSVFTDKEVNMQHLQPAGIGKLFSIIALLEGITWAGLLFGMFLKYTLKTSTLGVSIFGPLHGIVFISYVLVTLLAAMRLRWPLWATLIAIVSAVPPLVTIPMEIWFKRRGLLSVSTLGKAAVGASQPVPREA